MSNPSNLGDRLQEVWRQIVQAEHARGSATAGAQAAYEEALRQFRHMQLEAFTVSLGSIDLLREQVAELVLLREQVAELAARVEVLEQERARAAGDPT